MPPRRSKRTRDGDAAEAAAATVTTTTTANTAMMAAAESSSSASTAGSSNNTSIVAPLLPPSSSSSAAAAIAATMASSASATTTTTSSSSPLLADLLHQIRSLSESPSRCSAALRALMDGTTALSGIMGTTASTPTTTTTTTSTVCAAIAAASATSADGGMVEAGAAASFRFTHAAATTAANAANSPSTATTIAATTSSSSSSRNNNNNMNATTSAATSTIMAGAKATTTTTAASSSTSSSNSKRLKKTTTTATTTIKKKTKKEPKKNSKKKRNPKDCSSSSSSTSGSNSNTGTGNTTTLGDNTALLLGGGGTTTTTTAVAAALLGRRRKIMNDVMDIGRRQEGGEGHGESWGGGGGGGDGSKNSSSSSSSVHDAHLLLATTQAINTLLSHWKRNSPTPPPPPPSSTTTTSTEAAATATTSASASAATTTDAAMVAAETTDNERRQRRNIAILLISLSHPLMTCLVNDRPLLECITKANTNSSSSSSSKSSLSATTTTTTTTSATASTTLSPRPSPVGSSRAGGGGGGVGGGGIATTTATTKTTIGSSRSKLPLLDDATHNDEMFGAAPLVIGRGGGGGGGVGGSGSSGGGSGSGLSSRETMIPPSSSSSALHEGRKKTGSEQYPVAASTTTATTSSSSSSTVAKMAGGDSSSAGATTTGMNNDETKRLSMSHAKAAVGRALSSGVMGALYGMEILGKLLGDVNNNDDAQTITIIERTILRKSLWTSLLTLEMSFQLSPRPKLLSTSSVLSPTCGTLRNYTASAACSSSTTTTLLSPSTATYSSGMDGPWGTTAATTTTSTSAAAASTRMMSASLSGMDGPTSPHGSGGGGGGGSGGGVSFSPSITTAATTPTTASSSSSSLVGHAHLTMGTETISMWNTLFSRIMAEYRIEFQYPRRPGATMTTTTATIEQMGRNSLHVNVEDDVVGRGPITESDYLVQICLEVTDMVFVEVEEADSKRLISLVLHDYSMTENKYTRGGEEEEDGGIAEPPKKTSRTVSTSASSSGVKRGGRGGGKQASKDMRPMSTPLYSSADIYSELSTILSSRIENHISFDCHVSIRRWAVLAFGWLCSGQKRLLDMGAVMLSNANAWGPVMEMMTSPNSAAVTKDIPGKASVVAPSLPLFKGVVDSTLTAVASSTKRKKRKKGNDKSSSSSAKHHSSFGFDSDIMETMDRSIGDGSSTAVPGNLALVIFVSAVIDMVYDAGVTGGMSPPSAGWMDEYIKAVLGGGGVVSAVDDEVKPTESNPSTEANMAAPTASVTAAATAADITSGVRRSSRQRSKTTKSSTNTTVAIGSPRASRTAQTTSSPRSRVGGHSINKRVSYPSVWVRPDIRDETAVLTKYLIERHLKTMNDNFNIEKDNTGSCNGLPRNEFVLVNDDDSFFGLAMSPSGRRPSPATTVVSPKESSATIANYYYPFMHRTLETLGRVVASSSFIASSSDSMSKIMALGSAVALGCFFQCYEKGRESGSAVVVDAKLFSLAICQFSESLNSVLSEDRDTGRTASPLPSSVAKTPASIPPSVLNTYRLNDPLNITRKDPKLVEANLSARAGASSFEDSMADIAASTAGSEKRSSGVDASTISAYSSGRSNQADILALYVRAQISPDGSTNTTVYDDAIASLLQSLLVIIRVCYNFSSDMHCQSSESCISAKPLLNKKKSTASKKKIRCATEAAPSLTEMSGQKLYPRKTYTRSVLASDALHVLAQSLSDVDKMRTTSPVENAGALAALCIRSHLRTCFSTNMAIDFIKLGYRLEASLVRPRLSLAVNDIDLSAATSALSDSDISSIGGLNFSSGANGFSKDRIYSMLEVSNLFELWERHLWACHTHFSILVGGGGGQMHFLDHPIKRLLVFRAIVEAEKELLQSVCDDDDVCGQGSRANFNNIARSSWKDVKTAEFDGADLWPLHLSAVQHSLVTPMILLASRSTADHSAGIDDLSVARHLQQPIELHFLCVSFLNSFELIVEDPSQLQKASSGMVLIDGDVSISLSDARLFSLAMSKLSKDVQRRMFSRLVSLIQKGLQAGTFKVENCDLSHFFARGITLCIALMEVMSSPNLSSLLAKEVEASTFIIPRLVLNQNHYATAGSIQVHSVQFRKDVYQSIFAHWQLPTPPASDVACNSISDIEHLESAIRLALSFGFESSATDGCHLLFSSWNAAAKLASLKTAESPSSAAGVKSLGAVERIVKIREDMCELYHFMQEDETQDNRGDAPLTRVQIGKSPHHTPNKSPFSGLAHAEESISFLMLELDKNAANTSTTETITPILATFAYFEALPLYVSFLISMHSSPGTNDMGLAHRLQKSTSLLSARGSKLLQQKLTNHLAEESDLETTNDGGNILRMSALTRLHKACLTLGAAPCYPDWLDTSCKLREHITPSAALDSANRALVSLTRFGVRVWRSYFDAMVQVLFIIDETGDIKMRDNEGLQSTAAYRCALQYFFAQQRHPSELSDMFYSMAAACCQTSSSVFKLLFSSTSSQSRVTGDDLVRTSAQRILGANFVQQRKVFMGEHRANGQWETLLAEVLQGSSLTIPLSTIAKANGGAVGSSDDSNHALNRIAESLKVVHRWRRVLCSVINAIVPAAALLRFSINDGKGQNRHTTSCEDSASGLLASMSERRGRRKGSEKLPIKYEAAASIKRALSFLSFVAAYSPHDEDIRLTSRSAGGTLLQNSSHFNDLMAMWSVVIFCDAMRGGVRMLEDKDGVWTKTQKDASCAMITSTLNQFSCNTGVEVDKIGLPTVGLNDALNCDKIAAFQACLGVKRLKIGRLIGDETDTDLMEILADCEELGLMQREISERFSSGFAISLLLNLLCGKVPGVRGRVQIFVAEMLILLMNVECEVSKQGIQSLSMDSVSTIEVARINAASSLDDLSKEDVKCLVKNLASNAVDTCEELQHLSRKTAFIISFLACVLPGGRSVSGCKIIFDELLSCLDRWAGSPRNHHLIKLLFLLAIRFGALQDAVTAMIRLVKSRNKGGDTMPQHNISILKDFFQYVSLLDRLVNKKSSAVTQLANNSPASHQMATHRVDDSCVTLKNGKVVSRTCSFVETGEGFTEQHWYNCYTCGLLWEKGCCSLCVRVCHKGHDIGYSRKSSFFCDCGAEVAHAIEQNRTPCKCLTPVSEDIIRASYEGESQVTDELESNEQGYEIADTFTELMATSFPSICKASVQMLVEEAVKSEWRESILLLFNQCFQGTSSTQSATRLVKQLGVAAASQPIAGPVCPNLQSRSGKPLALKYLDTTCMLPIRAAKASAIQTRMISSGTSSISGHLRKSASNFHAQAIASDNRGRLFIAESSSVLFCSAIPSVNVRHVVNPPNSHLSRSQLSILGSDSVKFPIIGLAINSENNRHLLVWGSSKACVAIISKNLDSFERIIELKLNLDSSEECEYLIKCEWTPQSELHLVAVCGAVVHVFDLKRAKNNTCNATTHYALAYEDVLIRSATFIEGLLVNDGLFTETRLAILLDTGRLHFISLTIDEEGNLEDQGESYIEIGDGVSFPSAGIRRYCSGDVSPKGATATSFGEGLYLVHLKLANVLLYQCVSSCCIGMLLDDDGAICGSFEFLPNTISADDIGSHAGVAGPYTQFQELGVVTKGGESFFRVSCVGRSTRSTQPTALVLEFNDNSMFVRELTWPTSYSRGLCFISSYSFVGSCTFSCPYLVGGDATEGVINHESRVHERSYLTLLASSGSLLWFGEAVEPPARTRSLPNAVNQVPAIGVFEQLINASELDGLILGGDFVGKDPKTIKRKLSLNNTDCVVCPSREGCTLTASLRMTDESSLAIVAVRLLVGSMPDLVPREVIVMGSGRSIKLMKSMKRWYDFHLTDEEILLSMRNGFVTIWISSCHDSSSASIIDSVEVYARARADLPITSERIHRAEEEPSNQRVQSESILVSCIRSMTYLTQITGQSNVGSLSAESEETIRRIIQQTALESPENGTLREHVIEFLSEAEADVEKRTFFIDGATMRGLMSSLQCLGLYLLTQFANIDMITPKQEDVINRAIDMLVRTLTSAITIARERPDNYVDVMSSMIDKNLCQGSMALEGKRALDFCLHLKAMFGAALRLGRPTEIVSKFMLMEMSSSKSDFAQFDALTEFLVADSTEIIKACCSAISDVIGYSDVSKITAITSYEKEQSIMPVMYQCDSCLMFPITGQRYTLGGEMDIDLCKRCYELGSAYSRLNDQNDPVIINGRTLCVENKDMTCGIIWQMTPQPIGASSLEQAENAKKAGLLNNMTCAANTVDPTFRNEISSQSMELSCSSFDDKVEEAATEVFRSQLFTQLLALIVDTLDAEKHNSPPSRDVLQLILDLVLRSPTEDIKISRGKEAALAFTKNLPSLIKTCLSKSNPSVQYCKLTVSLRTLTSLVVQDRDIKRDPTVVAAAEDETDAAGTSYHMSKDKTDPRFICEVHGVPAVRRRCSHGVHKDRRFYVCGLERSQRCNYFKWSSDVPESSPQFANNTRGTIDSFDLFVPIQMDLQRIFSDNELQGSICDLVSNQFQKYQAEQADGNLTPERPSSSSFPSIKTEAEKMQDIVDGVHRALEKLGKTKPVPSQSADVISSSVADERVSDLFLSSSLDLLSLIAPTTNSTSWCSYWFSVLCEIISRNSIDASSTTSASMRQLAKTMLLRLCGDRQEVYHRVRDHYVFGFQFRKLLQRSQDILDSALVVREQARQCGPTWSDDEVLFETLPASDLLGVADLISEDLYATSTEESITIVLDELIASAGRAGNGIKARSNSWRIFCGLPGLQTISHQQKPSSHASGGEIFDMVDQIYYRPPILSLMWLSSCLRGSNQVKALSLIDIALEDLHESTLDFQADNIDHDDFLVGGYQTSDNCSSDPEQNLLNTFGVDDLLAFIKEFVINGRSKDLRSISSRVARKLAVRFSTSKKNHLFAALIDRPLQNVGSLGSTSKHFFELMRVLVDCFGPELDLTSVSSFIAQAFSSQMTALNQVRRCKTDADLGSCNLSDCVHCHRQIPAKKSIKPNSRKAENTSPSVPPSACRSNFLPEQVRPYQRGRIEASTASSASSEFSSYHQLKFRVALSQVHVTVSEPRGRLVKSIGVYFSPRQVRDANILKSSKYVHHWQRCGTLSLARGASEATCKLKTPVIAANLRFFYEEFYEKASNRRAPDGSFILNCPRCTRQVHNAHGVCGNCGEVAFQCRKCRHINYDGLDAFLCVECGYCTSGGFSYELTAGLALSAIAIMDEDGFQRSMAMLRVANKRLVEIRDSLRKKLYVATHQQKKVRGDQIFETLDEMVFYGPQLKRALLGGMPKLEGMDDEDETNKKSGSSRSKSSSLNAAERALSSSSRARSLLNIARTLRAEGGDSLGTRGELLRQALLSVGGGSGTSGVDSLDVAELLNALSTTGGNSTSSTDSLSRIVANVNARSRDVGSSTRGTSSGDGGGATTAAGDKSEKHDKPKLSPTEERYRLYTQMREAERECYELNRRINAWTRLNEDRLKGSSPATTKHTNMFLPSTCSYCSLQMTYDLLSLLHSIYSTNNIAQWEHTVTANLIQLLLKESVLSSTSSSIPKQKELKDLKQQVLITLACTSEVGSKILLAELRSRLEAVQDVNSAEILGMLLELDFPFVNEYIELAMSTLSRLL